MFKSRKFCVSLLAVGALAACAAAPEAPPRGGANLPAAVEGQAHWLIGTWTGDRVGRQLQGNVNRTLRVTSVDSTAGTAVGRWAGQDVRIQIRGSTIYFFSSGNTPIQLTYTAPSTLQGTTSAGNLGSFAAQTIIMQRSAPRS